MRSPLIETVEQIKARCYECIIWHCKSIPNRVLAEPDPKRIIKVNRET